LENGLGGACSTYGAMRNAYRILTGTLEQKKPLGKTRHKWEDSIKMDLREIR
jgi:hypothetical protein